MCACDLCVCVCVCVCVWCMCMRVYPCMSVCAHVCVCMCAERVCVCMCALTSLASFPSSPPTHTHTRYSPVHTITACPGDTQYPATLLLTGDHDDRVVPLHSFKFISQLQHQLGKRPNQVCGGVCVFVYVICSMVCCGIWD